MLSSRMAMVYCSSASPAFYSSMQHCMAVHIIAKVCLALFLDGRLCSYHSVLVVTDFCNPSEEVAPSRILYFMLTQ